MNKLIDEKTLNSEGIEIVELGNDSKAPCFSVYASTEKGGIKIWGHVEEEDVLVGGPLSKEELVLLEECEEQVRTNISGHIRTAIALSTIQSKKLYRQHYSTFAEYLEAKLDIGRSHGYRLIAAAKAFEDLSPLGDTRALSLNALKPYGKLTADQKAKVKASIKQELDAAEDDKITVAVLNAAVEAVVPKPLKAKKTTVDFAELLRITEEALNLHGDPEHKDDVEGLLLELKQALSKLAGKKA